MSWACFSVLLMFFGCKTARKPPHMVELQVLRTVPQVAERNRERERESPADECSVVSQKATLKGKKVKIDIP